MCLLTRPSRETWQCTCNNTRVSAKQRGKKASAGTEMCKAGDEILASISSSLQLLTRLPRCGENGQVPNSQLIYGRAKPYLLVSAHASCDSPQQPIHLRGARSRHFYNLSRVSTVFCLPSPYPTTSLGFSLCFLRRSTLSNPSPMLFVLFYFDELASARQAGSSSLIGASVG